MSDTNEVAKANVPVPQEIAESNLAAMDIPISYIPSLKITYKTSKHFEEGKAKLGDFFLNEQSLGSEIEVTALGYRYQAMARDKVTKEFQETLILAESKTPFRQRTEYIQFVKENERKCDIIDGIDVLLYLPKQNLFGVLFAKKKLQAGGLAILKVASEGKIAKIKTVPKEWKTFAWYVLNVVPTAEVVLVEDAEEKLEIYTSQTTDGTFAEETETSGRQR